MREFRFVGLSVAWGVVLAAVFFGPTVAEQQRTMDVIDFVVDATSLSGQRVTVTGCQIEMADHNWLSCFARGTSTRFLIDSPTLEREARRRALRKCSSPDELSYPIVTAI